MAVCGTEHIRHYTGLGSTVFEYQAECKNAHHDEGRNREGGRKKNYRGARSTSTKDARSGENDSAAPAAEETKQAATRTRQESVRKEVPDRLNSCIRGFSVLGPSLVVPSSYGNKRSHKHRLSPATPIRPAARRFEARLPNKRRLVVPLSRRRKRNTAAATTRVKAAAASP